MLKNLGIIDIYTLKNWQNRSSMLKDRGKLAKFDRPSPKKWLARFFLKICYVKMLSPYVRVLRFYPFRYVLTKI